MDKNVNTPKISVITCAFKAERYLPEAIESVLAQTFTDFEYLIVNDNSPDLTKQIIEKYAQQDKRVKLIDNPENIGTYASANKALEQAKGKYIARLDADDYCASDRLQKQLEFMEQNQEYTLVGSWVKLVDEEGVEFPSAIWPTTYEEVFAFMFFSNPIVHSTVFFRKDAVEELGNYSTARTAQDFDLWARILKNGMKLCNFPEQLVVLRRHSQNMTAKSNDIQEEVSREIIRSLNKEILDNDMPDVEMELLRTGVFHPSKGEMSVIKKVQYAMLLKKYYKIFTRKFPVGTKMNEQFLHRIHFHRGKVGRWKIVRGFYKLIYILS